MRTRIVVICCIGLLVAAPPAAAQSITGHTVHVDRTGSRGLEGELLAVTADSLWLLADRQVTAVTLQEVRKSWVRRLGAPRSQTALMIGIGTGLVSGLLLTVACASVEDASCGAVLPVFALNGLLYGGLAARSIEGASRRQVDPTAGALAPYARFPQGPPAGLDLRTLGVATVP